MASGIIFIGCPDPVEDPYPPETPVWVNKTLPESSMELGIDAENRNRIVLMWHPNTDTDLAGYTIYRADTTIDNSFENHHTIDLIQHVGLDTVFFDEVIPYVDYFYFIRANDIAGNDSPPSDTVTYKLLRAPRLESPIDESVSSQFTFTWMDLAAHFTYSTEYVIRMEKNVDNHYEPYWICRFTNQWYGYENESPIPFPFFPAGSNQPSNILSVIGSDSFPEPGDYRWKVKAISEVDNATNLDEASGESDWGFFEVE